MSQTVYPFVQGHAERHVCRHMYRHVCEHMYRHVDGHVS